MYSQMHINSTICICTNRTSQSHGGSPRSTDLCRRWLIATQMTGVEQICSHQECGEVDDVNPPPGTPTWGRGGNREAGLPLAIGTGIFFSVRTSASRSTTVRSAHRHIRDSGNACRPTPRICQNCFLCVTTVGCFLCIPHTSIGSTRLPRIIRRRWLHPLQLGVPCLLQASKSGRVTDCGMIAAGSYPAGQIALITHRDRNTLSNRAAL